MIQKYTLKPVMKFVTYILNLCLNKENYEKTGGIESRLDPDIEKKAKRIDALKYPNNERLRKSWQSQYGEDNPEMPIDIADLSYRIKNHLIWEDLNTIEELSLRSKKDILKIRGVGRKSLQEIEKYLLNKFGIKL